LIIVLKRLGKKAIAASRKIKNRDPEKVRRKDAKEKENGRD
jgi:hypothetical protein